MEFANPVEKPLSGQKNAWKDGEVGMKKLIIFLIMLIIIVCLAGCGKVKDENGVYRDSHFGLIEIENISGPKYLLYDPETKVIYMYTYDGHRGGLSPYYVISADGKPEIAVYGVNYLQK